MNEAGKALLTWLADTGSGLPAPEYVAEHLQSLIEEGDPDTAANALWLYIRRAENNEFELPCFRGVTRALYPHVAEKEDIDVNSEIPAHWVKPK